MNELYVTNDLFQDIPEIKKLQNVTGAPLLPLLLVNHNTILHLHRLCITPDSSHSWACIPKAINITTVLSSLILSPFHSCPQLISSNLITFGMILHYFITHLSLHSDPFQFILLMLLLSEIRNSTISLFSLTFSD